MSRALRRQVLDLADLLGKANRTLKTHLTLRNIDREGCCQLLSDCQETAIRIGNELEAIYGEGTKSVCKLEEYCESLYQMTLALGNPVKSRKLLNELSSQVRQIRRLIGEQIPDRLEAVFLPYKASMWDSLESVWMTAEEDEECDAYVVPIPYYDRNQDGSFGQYHYEGGELPDYVPVIHYEDYDLQRRRPDVVFIHNPYDQCNYVTSIAPEFYSKELKNYADKLVYIPYFVLGEIDPDDKEAVKGMAHFCVVPGVLHADQVIVQSENMRRAYINALVGEYGEKTREIWEKKIFGFGSPKFDKVRNTRKEDIRLPEQWQQIIEKPDGSQKKIILYNISVTALLQYEERMLEKIQSVFRIFQEEREEIALLWRPHPLAEATIRSMRPQMQEAYCQLVEEYKCAGWGIYDDSAELERAIALCDAYYGDHSSLVQLCQEAGKPIMIQNIDII